MSQRAERWPRVDVVAITVVSLALLGVIIGSSFVMGRKNSTGYVMPLEDGAYIGGIIAAACAAVVVIGAFVFRFREARLIHVTLSVIHVLIPLYSASMVSSRVGWEVEEPNSDVFAGQSLYVAAGGLLVVAALTGIARYQLSKRRSQRVAAP